MTLPLEESGTAKPDRTETLVVIEHDGQRAKASSLHAITLARLCGKAYALLAIGQNLGAIAASLVSYGAAAVLVADDPALAHPLADRYAAVIADVARFAGAKTIVATSSTFTKDVLPRAAALLDAPMLTDVLAVEERDGFTTYRRPIYAGRAFATVKLDGDIQVLTIRAAAFDAPDKQSESAVVKHVEVDAAALPDGMEFVAREHRHSDRPDLTEARVVVSGGRPLKDRETFERLIGGLADALGGAVGATRAAVDAGIVPSDQQIGQTGKVVAPDLYIAVGISGSVQHLAGIKDSRVIVAINKDPDAPIFQMATYGMVGDLYEIVPGLIEAVKRS